MSEVKFETAIELLRDSLDYLGNGPVDPEELYEKIGDFLDAFKKESAISELKF